MSVLKIRDKNRDWIGVPMIDESSVDGSSDIMWKPDTQYTVGQVAIRNYKDGTVVLECKADHTSSVEDFEHEYTNCWIVHMIYAYVDINGRPIAETYATKDEVGNINEALEAVLNGGN